MRRYVDCPSGPDLGYSSQLPGQLPCILITLKKADLPARKSLLLHSNELGINGTKTCCGRKTNQRAFFPFKCRVHQTIKCCELKINFYSDRRLELGINRKNNRMFAANCKIQSYVKEKVYSNPTSGGPPLCLHILIFVSEWMRREMVWSDFLPITLLPIISQSGKGSFFCLLLWLMDFRYNWRIWFWNLNLLIFRCFAKLFRPSHFTHT